jgi:hypothetical protein
MLDGRAEWTEAILQSGEIHDKSKEYLYRLLRENPDALPDGERAA